MEREVGGFQMSTQINKPHYINCLLTYMEVKSLEQESLAVLVCLHCIMEIFRHSLPEILMKLYIDRTIKKMV